MRSNGERRAVLRCQYRRAINAGIDIINAICRFEGISAPIFADGSESVNTLHPTQSQVIRLYVSLDDKLVIKHNGNPAQPKSLFD